MPQRDTKPADGFHRDDRIYHEGKNGTVTERVYLDDKRSISLGILPDSGGAGVRVIFRSDDLVAVGDPLSVWQRLRPRRESTR